MEKPKFRHELKQIISRTDCLALRQRLRAVLAPDPYAGSGGEYSVRSLYFDTPDDRALREKIDGVSNREKFRLRAYNGEFSTIKLEKKSKIHGLCLKESVLLPQEDCRRLIAGDIAWMGGAGHPLLTELYLKMLREQLRPKALVDYIREPFVYPPGNVRVTIDRQIRTGLHSRDFFNPLLPTMPAGQSDTMILEVKFDDFLPEIVGDLIQTKDRGCTAFSKYAASRIYE
jgi:hypothetical protein